MAFKGKNVYLVEGADEKNLVQTFIRDMRLIQPGKIHVLNVILNHITKLKVSTWGEAVRVIMVFDTDVEKTDVFEQNIALLKKLKNVQDILFIPQVYNLEDELKRSTNVKNVLEITNSSSLKGFKRDLSTDCQLDKHLQKVNFDFHKFWGVRPDGKFKFVGNDIERIRL